MRRGERLAWWGAGIPPVVVVVVLFLYPAAQSVLSSLRGEDGGGWTLKYYGKAWSLYASDVGYSLWATLVGLLLALAAAVVVAAYCCLRGDRLVEWLFKIPLFVPFVVVGHAFRIALAPHGLLALLLSHAGLVNLDHPPNFTGTWLGLAVTLAWKNVALALLLILGAFRGVDKSYLEAAQNFGARAWRLVTDVLLPMSATQVAVVAVLIFCSMLASFSIPVLLSGQTARMIMVDVYYNIVYQQAYGVANALGVISYLLSAGAAIYYIRSVTVK